MLVLSASDVRRALPMHEAIEAVKGAYAALSDGRAEVPLRSRLPVPPHEGLTLLMPAFVKGAANEALGVKVVSLFPGNPEKGIPYIQAAVLVMEPDTGRALALLEGSSLTAIRTGAAGGAAVDVLSRPESSVLAVFGAGAQARTQLLAACTVRTISEAWIFDTNRQHAQALVSDLAGTPPIPQDLRVASTPQQAARGADIICTATTSLTPVFADSDLKDGTHISAIGSYTPEMQEIPAETVARARVVVDSRSAALAETGDLIKPMEAGLFAPEHIHAELGEILLAHKVGRQSSAEITFFKSVGIAVQDAFAADAAVKRAREMGLGREVEF
jgi:ornithine cyclodeaminase/alanine dehydrogenase-like protein (mu-crystallin family)